MTTVRITIRHNIDETYVRVADINISDELAEILSSIYKDTYDEDAYDDAWDYLVEEVIPQNFGHLPPDWYIDGLKYLKGDEQ